MSLRIDLSTLDKMSLFDEECVPPESVEVTEDELLNGHSAEKIFVEHMSKNPGMVSTI